METKANKKVKRLFLGIVTGVILFSVLVACTNSQTTTPTSTIPQTLTSIQVTPALQNTIAVSDSIQFSATGKYSNGSYINLTSKVTWTSSDPKMAHVADNGLSTGLAVGSTEITASLSGITSAPVSLTVVAQLTTVTPTTSPQAPVLVSIQVNPSSTAQVKVASTLQFSAIGTYSDNSTADITAKVTWTSSDKWVCKISDSGLATGLAPGISKIKASQSGIISLATFLTVKY
jgi:trimeric autotransporter adhesin